MSGTMTARVTSAKANDIYAGRCVRPVPGEIDADREDKGQGQESMVRLAKPYGGDVRLSPADRGHGGGDCFPRRRP
ncbi:hypothetical protein J4734_20410 [Klebsiella pneumoniae]|uniref:Uncharacterized protein n=1 Tax=Klebsiella pneumoniae TaxID=573 RepID=A0A939NNE4_KLEPN|nr:hypothetical protein [Klebsiella pneumoniae]